MRKQRLSANCIFQFPFFITHFLDACEPKTNICLARGLPTDGNADLRMNTTAACGFEMKPVKVSDRKLDHGSRTSCCRSRKCPRTVHPQFGLAIRGNYQTLAFCRFAARAIRRLNTFGGSGDIWSLGRFDDRSSRINQGRTLSNREVISRQFLRLGIAQRWSRLRLTLSSDAKLFGSTFASEEPTPLMGQSLIVRRSTMATREVSPKSRDGRPLTKYACP